MLTEQFISGSRIAPRRRVRDDGSFFFGNFWRGRVSKGRWQTGAADGESPTVNNRKGPSLPEEIMNWNIVERVKSQPKLLRAAAVAGGVLFLYPVFKITAPARLAAVDALKESERSM